MTRTLLLSLHIASIASWLGADVVQHAVRRRWEREEGATALAWARMVYWMHDRYYAVVVLLIVLSGVGLVFEGDFSWSSGFIWVGIGNVLLGAIFGGVVLKKLYASQVTAWEAGDAQSARAARRRAAPIELFLTAAVLVTVVAMVDRWMAS